MLKKKYLFEMNVVGPENALTSIIEDAGYHIFKKHIHSNNYYEITTEECASCKEDIAKFVKDINEVSGLELKFHDNEESGICDYKIKNSIIIGITVYDTKIRTDATFNKDDTRFNLSYNIDDCLKYLHLFALLKED